MTDPVSELEEVVVYGNRRSFGSSGGYGVSGGGGGGGANEPPGIHQNEIGEQEDPPYQYDPCDTPEKRLAKATDAAAAQALAEIEGLAAAADEDGLNARERGCYLFRNSDGTVSAGPIAEGPLFEFGGVGTVSPGYGGRYAGDIVGSVHSHSAGNYLPSTAPNGGGDRGHFNSMVETVRAANGISGSVRMYIAAQRLVGAGPPAPNVMTVYEQSNLESSIDSGEPGPEVDPEGQPCPPA